MGAAYRWIIKVVALIVVKQISTAWKTIVAQTLYSNIKHDGHVVTDTKGEKLIFLLSILGFTASFNNQLPQLHPISPSHHSHSLQTIYS